MLLSLLRTVIDVGTTVLKILISIVWATYRLIIPVEERSVANDLVLVTGAGHGIGRQLARQYGLLGAQVICVDINSEANKATVKELKELEIKAYAYTCDVSNREAVFSLAAEIRKEVGFVTILVNNAGIMPCKRFIDHTPEDIHKIFDVNVLSQFWTLQAFLPAMMSNNYGHVIALSSIAGLGGYPNLAPYCSSKNAIRGLMDGLVAETRQTTENIRFTTVYPFMVDTGLCKKPRIGSPSILNMQKPEKVAARIISAQRRGHREVSAPFFVQWLSNLEKLFPDKAKFLIDDSLKTGSDPV